VLLVLQQHGVRREVLLAADPLRTDASDNARAHACASARASSRVLRIPVRGQQLRQRCVRLLPRSGVRNALYAWVRGGRQSRGVPVLREAGRPEHSRVRGVPNRAGEAQPVSRCRTGCRGDRVAVWGQGRR